MPKKKKTSLLKIFLDVVIKSFWYLLISVIPAFIAIYQYFVGTNRMSIKPSLQVWIAITVVIVLLSLSIGFYNYSKELKMGNKPKKRPRNTTSKTVRSNVKNGGQSVAVGGNNLAPIIQGITHPPKQRPDLSKLNEVRRKGYLLRNEGMKPMVEIQVDEWLVRFNNWNGELIQAVEEVDRDKAQDLVILGNVPMSGMNYQNHINSVQRGYLEIMTEKLRRLDKIREDYMRLSV